ncbi:MAG TPA: 2-oxo acid dehydrogenase subunit E2, partial [Pyrinomonadaceae bacterium]|nr:2-oxo acid dehydrogenase subunit E2 [Pyrinomonadaceae bacterium]
MSQDRQRTDYSEIIAENFGANATYVEGLLNRFRSDPSSVDEAWRAYFDELLGTDAAAVGASDNGSAAASASRAETDGDGAAEAWPTTHAATPADATQAQTPQAQTTPARTQTQEAAPTQTQEAAPAQAATTTAQTPSTATPAQTPAKAATQTGATTQPAPQPAPAPESAPIRGGALKIVENMEASLGVPVATSNRHVPVKALEENRLIVNQHLKEQGGGKTSYTHFVAYAILRALEEFPQMNDGFALVEGQPSRVKRAQVNLGIAIDLQKKDGSRTLLVPNVKNAGALTFSQFVSAYDDVVQRARAGKLGVADFQETTVSLTNPGTIGTVSSNPRLMAGQSLIVATGAIEYPAEYHAMTPEALSQLGISKIVNVSSTYDHRI